MHWLVCLHHTPGLPLKSRTHTHTHIRMHIDTSPHMCRDKWLIAVYSAVSVIVATVNLVIFVYLLVAVVIEVCTCMYQYRATTLRAHALYMQKLSLFLSLLLQRDCSSFPDPASLLGCSHRLWLSLALYPIQALIFIAGSLTAVSLLANFTFEVV